MKNKFKNILFLSVLLIATGITAISCEDHPQHIESSWGDGMNVKDEILLDGVTSQTLNIRAATKPTLKSDSEWLKIGEVKNLTTGIYTVELTAEVNATGESRTARISVTAGKETATVTVTQVSSDVVEILSVDPQGELDPEGCILTIKYHATATPATNLPDWIKETGTRSLVEGELKFTVSPNDTGRDREGIIVLAVGKDAVANVTVRQGAKK